MKSAIKEIFHGFRGHMETMQMPRANLDDSGEKLCDAYDELNEKLSPELLEMHQKFVEVLEKSNSEEIDFFYAEGVKLGLLIGLECAKD